MEPPTIADHTWRVEWLPAPMAPERDYTHRSTVQKLGMAPDQRVEVAGDVGSGLRRDVKEAIGRGLVRSGDWAAVAVLVESVEEARPRSRPTGRGCATPAVS